MVKKFTYPCLFGSEKHPVTFYVGNAAEGAHPIGFQAQWLSKERGCTVPEELMDALKKLKDLSDEQKVPFEDLCDYVIAELQGSVGEKKEEIMDETQRKNKAKQQLEDLAKQQAAALAKLSQQS